MTGINIGNYLEQRIKVSEYKTKKAVFEELCNRYYENEELSYSSFSRDIKNGTLTFNQAIELATIIPIDINKIVNVLKNQYNKKILTEKGENNMKQNIMKEIAKILGENSIANVKYEETNILEIVKFEVYEGLFLSNDNKTVIVERIDIEGETGLIQEVAHFTNFDEILGECGMSFEEFNKMPLNEKITFVAEEGQCALEILGEDMREKEFDLDQYNL